jgi:hypothetical protein
VGREKGKVGRTESRDCMYLTCASIASWSSVGRGVEELPPRPGPATSDIL